MDFRVVTIFLVNCWGMSHAIIIDPKKHYSMTPEVKEKLVLLLEQDRNVLKTLLTNQALFYENSLMTAVFSSYNASLASGNCAISEERQGIRQIRMRRRQLESKIDTKIDSVISKWTDLQTQDDLETYWFGDFWPNREALYDYVSNKNQGPCGNPEDENDCTSFGALEKDTGEVMLKILNCTAQNGAPHHFDLTPETIEVLKTLVRQDRNVLKTIDENHATLHSTFALSMVVESYNFSTGTSECAIASNRARLHTIIQRKEINDKKIDKDLDIMLSQWDNIKTQADLETYLVKFWADRNAIYNYVSHKGKYEDCEDNLDGEQCSGFGAMDQMFGKLFESLSQCKVKFWQPQPA